MFILLYFVMLLLWISPKSTKTLYSNAACRSAVAVCLMTCNISPESSESRGERCQVQIWSFVSATNREITEDGISPRTSSHWLLQISGNVIRSDASRDDRPHLRRQTAVKMPAVRIKSSRKRRQYVSLTRR